MAGRCASAGGGTVRDGVRGDARGVGGEGHGWSAAVGPSTADTRSRGVPDALVGVRVPGGAAATVAGNPEGNGRAAAGRYRRSVGRAGGAASVLAGADGGMGGSLALLGCDVL